MPPSVPPDITRHTSAARSRGKAMKHQPKRLRGVAAGEIVDAAIALSLAEDRHDCLRIDATGGDRVLDAAHIVGPSG